MQAYIVPFLIYIVATLAAGSFESYTLFFYPVKIVLVLAALWHYRAAYVELHRTIDLKMLGRAVLAGIAVFFVWVLPEGMYPVLGNAQYNPLVIENMSVRWFLIGFRLFGAVVIVPVFEELFWRSFLLRWIIKADFKEIAIGRFTWSSFIVVTLLFGFEHERWLVGLFAGAAYNALIYREKNLWSCVAAHAVTNLALGVYVLVTRQWSFW